tara:strand:+ start:600 stop:1124 length:525 start_codon:yes stop_codon:yes gene_type:complete
LNVKEYFDLLGGKDFPEETQSRVMNFSKELETKRNYDRFTTFDTKNDEMIVINKIKLFSFCEHHLLPFFGYCYIGYIPTGKILGLSKFQRAVDKICSKPTLQENITEEIASFLDDLLHPLGLGVALSCIHTCMFGRGINTSTITVNSQVLKGRFRNEEVKTEFLMRIKNEDLFR